MAKVANTAIATIMVPDLPHSSFVVYLRPPDGVDLRSVCYHATFLMGKGLKVTMISLDYLKFSAFEMSKTRHGFGWLVSVIFQHHHELRVLIGS